MTDHLDQPEREPAEPAWPADEAPGWDAITAALTALAPDQEPLHWGADQLPGQGLWGMSGYRVDGAWLLVTLGLTELFSKETDLPEQSGWGFELTMRLPDRGETEPPDWALSLLAKLASYVMEHLAPFAEGHRMSPGGPITGQADTMLTALAFTADPQLGPITTPFGAVRFLTVVGITADELSAMQATTTATVLGSLRKVSPLLVTDVRA